MVIKQQTLEALDDLRRDFPMIVGSPAAENEVRASEHRLRITFSDDYKQFLSGVGSVILAGYHVLGLSCPEVADQSDTLESCTGRFRSESAWMISADSLVVALDGRGNPLVLRSSGEIWLHDHDSSGVLDERLYPSFGALLDDLVMRDRSLAS